MANVKFKKRARAAVESAQSEYGCIELSNGRLYGVVNRGGRYGWIHLMDTDGLLVVERQVSTTFDGIEPTSTRPLLIGVAVQSEDETAQTKPNPMGKAMVGSAPLGVWVDRKTAESDRVRTRLDRLFVLFLVPESIGTTSRMKRSKFDAAKRAVTNACDSTDDCRTLILPRGIGEDAMCERVIDALSGTLRGKGRPPSAS